MRRVVLSLMVVCLSVLGCDLLDPARPVAHPDTEIFGNLLEINRDGSGEPRWVVRVQIGVPRVLAKAETDEGRQAPPVEKGLIAEVVVNAGTVVLVGGRAGLIEDINPGTEVAVIPSVGTTRMLGTSVINVEARVFADFPSYALWQIPGLADPTDKGETRVDPKRINSDGVEHAPVPIAGGRVLYFSARFRMPEGADGIWAGAPREGLQEPAAGAITPENTYRTELADDGWRTPTLVHFAGVDEADSVRVSWVSEDETRCLLSVEGDEGAWIGSTTRAAASAPWMTVERLSVLDEAHVSDAVYLAGSQSKFVFTVRGAANAPGDLWLYDPGAEQTPLPLDPALNSAGSEWGPRVGPDNELFFSREDRQVIFKDKALNPVLVPGPHRRVVTEAAPTADGQWLFFCMPNYRPNELDQDIYVAKWIGGNRLDEPIPVDDWRP
jgi:hypothetical protein